MCKYLHNEKCLYICLSNLLLALRYLNNSSIEKALRCVVALKAFLFKIKNYEKTGY